MDTVLGLHGAYRSNTQKNSLYGVKAEEGTATWN
jgi:hypothetical protein